MKDFFKIVLGTIVGLFVFGIICSFFFILSLLGIVYSSDKNVVVKDNTVLKLNMSGEIVDRVNGSDNPSDILQAALFGGSEPLGLDELVRSIKKAKDNDKVKGIYMHFDGLSCGRATTEEIRRALLDFKESGKFIYSYSNIYSQGEYYIASLSDKIMLNPMGHVDWKGLSSSVMFYKDALDKLGVEMQIFKVGTYKSAVEPYIQNKMSDANREQVSIAVNSIWKDVVDAVSVSRNISPERLNQIADSLLAFASTENNIKYGMVDTLVYKADVEKTISNSMKIEKKDVAYISVSDLNKSKTKKDKKAKGNDNIAVYYATGEIKNGSSAMSSGDEMIGDVVVKDLTDLAEKDEIKAVVIRVNSPGGSAFASEQMWEAIRKLKEKKPVIVSMGDVAASGGYYMSCLADTIVAERTTITGSIGIFGMVPQGKKLLEKVGVSFDVVKTNAHSDFFTNSTMSKPFDQEERRLFQEQINDGYELFLKRCYEGRGMTREQIGKIAEGRIWVGATAKEIGLVDELGGLDRAIEIAAAKLGLENYNVVSYPAKKDWIETMFSGKGDAMSDALLKKELGEYYKYYKDIKSMTQKAEIKARMPFDMIIK